MSNEAIVIELLKRSLEQNDQIIARLAEADQSLSRHMDKEEALWNNLVGAFPTKPDGSPDFDGHETFHATLIEESRERTRMFRELRHEIIKKGFWGILLVLAALVTYWWNGHIIKP